MYHHRNRNCTDQQTQISYFFHIHHLFSWTYFPYAGISKGRAIFIYQVSPVGEAAEMTFERPSTETGGRQYRYTAVRVSVPLYRIIPECVEFPPTGAPKNP